MTAPEVDLFGNPTNTTPDGQTPPNATGEPAAASVNDMDATQAVLADVVSEKTAALHIDDHGRVTRCRIGQTTTPVPDSVATVVRQLLAAHYLTTRQRSCPGHGVEITTTRTGRNAVHRWRAYRRPSTWGPPPDPSDHTARTES